MVEEVRPSWDQYFLSLARTVSIMSKDLSTRTGCVVVRQDKSIAVTGYNGFPRNVNDTVLERTARPQKYMYTEHCERNAIYTAAAHGVVLKGCTIYITGPPCADCARAIIQVGIREVVWPCAHQFEGRKDWNDSISAAQQMLDEAGVKWHTA